MKISETRRPAAASHRKEVRPGGGAGFSLLAGWTGEAQGPVPGPSLAAPGAVLALQEVGDTPDGRRRATDRAHDILDELEKLRLAMVEGRRSERALGRLAAMIDAGGCAVDDAGLAGVLREVEVRAAVEIAKRETEDGS